MTVEDVEARAGIPPKDLINYWTKLIQEDLGTFTDMSRVRELCHALHEAKQLKYFLIEDTGIFAYMIVDDFKGGKALAELIFYIKPQYRGNLRLVKRYIKRAEKIAIDKCCKCVKIGANIDYKDSSLIKLLKRWGYVDDTVSKSLRG